MGLFTEQSSRAQAIRLVLAAFSAVLFFASLRLLAPLPWSYDEYYHLGVAREMRSSFPLSSFPWTPFSILADRYADKELLFHVALIPLSGLALERAAPAAAILGQLLVVGCFASALRSLRIPRAPTLTLALAAGGSMFAVRLAMARPHAWAIGLSILVVALLARRGRPLALFGLCWLYGLTHSAAWVAVAYALVFSGIAWFFARRREGVEDSSARDLLWKLPAAAAGGWLASQVLHPHFPHTLWLQWQQNVQVPLNALRAGSGAVHEMLGTELSAASPAFLRTQWPVFVAVALLLWRIVRHPTARTQASLATAAIAVVYLLVACLMLRRLFEMALPMTLLALGLTLVGTTAKPGSRRHAPFPVLALIGVAAYSTFTLALSASAAAVAPIGMGRWLGEHGTRDERVFTTQWADSAPLLYFAPQLQTLVALDPTFFYAKDPALFATYVEISLGRHPQPVAEIRGSFGASYVTIWKAPRFAALARQLARNPGAARVYDDRHYQVWSVR